MAVQNISNFESIKSWNKDEFYKYSDFLIQLLIEALESTDSDWMIPFLSKSNNGSINSWSLLEKVINKFDATKVQENFIQVISIYFHLLNIAENLCSLKSKSDMGESELVDLDSIVGKIQENNISKGDLFDFFQNLEIQPVLTAHSTEAKRVSVLEAHQRIYENLLKINFNEQSFSRNYVLRQKIKSQI